MGNCSNCINQTIKLNKSSNVLVDEIDDKKNIDLKESSKISDRNTPLSTLKIKYKKDNTLHDKNISLQQGKLKIKKKNFFYD